MTMSPHQLREKLKGVITLVMTPYKKNMDLDLVALREMLRFQVKKFKGKDVVFLAGGSTSEFYAMNDDEYKIYVKAVVEAVNGELPVILGSARAGTRYTIEASRYAQDAGADGVMVIMPYYHPVTEECLYEHYRAVANALKIGVTVYNNPMPSKLYIYPELMKKLSKIDNIVGLKENTSNPMLFHSLMKAIDPEDMVVFTGLGENMFQYTAILGARAFVCDIANFVPDIALGIYDAAVARDYVKMTALVDKVYPVYQFRGKIAKKRGPVPSVITDYLGAAEVPIYQSVVKEAMKLTGLDIGKVREPMYNLNDEEIGELRGVLKSIGVL
jgi:4-hydroxy-tetrahydrodipicolinate synthase